ncbi:S-adenosyl-L-methionine-dependent methyltransferase [Armillaria novae-zelandiae]|uniref:DNA (cytosine-5-)-methyltransferase n=1 Tax=Armillaria novae-zelandiae TaxID=153914 RepID=A0AA39NZY3_9AGAR|nr:S-adenosyl-L-methionine-dependent methyltransferase [Armillaria novae-zelandiae]
MEALLEKESGEDCPLVARVYAKSSANGLTSTDFASKDVRREPPLSPNYGSSSLQREHYDPIDIRDYSPGLEYVDRFDDSETTNDDGPAIVPTQPDHQANYGYDELPVDGQAGFTIECIQDISVAKPTTDIDDSEYVPVKSTFIDHQKFAVNNYYMVQLKSCDDSVHDSIVYVHSIRYPQDPIDEASNIAILQLSQYILWNLVHPDAPDYGLLLLFSEAELMGTIRDSEMFSANAIIKVREHVQISHRLDSDATGTIRHFVCNWSLRRAESCKAGTIETFIEVPEHLHALKPLRKAALPPRISSLTFGDIFCGVGGASCGFKEAGFIPQFGVEASYITGGVFEKNCRTANLYNESFDMFLGHPWSRDSLQTAVISVCPPSGIVLTVDKHPVIQVVDTFKPAYVVYNCSMDQLSTSNLGDLKKLQYQLLKLGYGLTYGVLKATDFGVSAIRNRLVLIAAAPAQHMPELPSPTHGGTDQPSTPTLQDAISDLDWNNPTCKSGLQSTVCHPKNCFQPISRHCTGCSITDFTRWDDSRTVADWNEPLPALLTVPSEKWKCRHPNNPRRFLSVRETARALSFPDSWDFSGSLEDQYNQVCMFGDL